MATRYLLQINQGSTFQERYEFYDSSGTALDFTGYEARMQIRPTITSNTVYCQLSSSLDADGTGISLTPTSASVTLPRTSGSFSITISAASSSLFDFTEAYYDMEIYSGSGATQYVYRLLEGKVKNFKNVTR